MHRSCSLSSGFVYKDTDNTAQKEHVLKWGGGVGGVGLTAPHHKGTYGSVWFFFIVASDCNFSDDDECFSEELQDLLPPAVTYLLLQNGFTVGVITLQRPCSVIHTFPVSAPCKKRENGKALAFSQTYCFKMHVEL